jgi:UDP-N-acetylglucosamine 2-epimerase (non-hydrolysing)
LGQKRYLSTVKNAAVVIGNSSSGIIEVPSFNVPTVNIGVRQKGRLAAKSVINCIATKASISSSIKSAITGDYTAPGEIITNPYGAGNASAQVIQMLKSLEFEQCKSFYDLK